MRFYQVLVVALLLAVASLAACASSPQGQRLRITNTSPNAITNLRVLFPEEEIAFGNIAANATTEYKVFLKGVYGYAAYRYDVNGETVTQPVIDWVGEEPMPGSSFTYTINYDPARPPIQQIQLVNVARDQ